MIHRISTLLLCIAGSLLILPSFPEPLPQKDQPTKPAFLGFDRNIYPGDDAMKIMRHDFAFTGYWLSAPPGEQTNTWAGKREFARSLGFGFLVLYRGRVERDLKNRASAHDLGESDARATEAAARREGFPKDTIIFLDIEEGGRLSAAYHAYIQGWLWTLTELGYQGGFYCSGIPVKEGPKTTITTTDDVTDFLFLKSRGFAIWSANDACPPSPGCTLPTDAPSPEKSGSYGASVWQYAQSPRRMEFAAHCPPGYASDGNCYARSDAAHAWFLDLDSANSPDPSNGR